MSRHYNSLYYAPDLDLFNRFEDPVYTPEVRELILQRKIDVFLILISLEHVMSSSMYNLLTSIPTQLGLSEESFWKKAVIAFSMKERSNPEQYIQESIGGSIGVRRMVEKVEYRYTYVLESEPDAFWSNLSKHIVPSLRITNEVDDVARYLCTTNKVILCVSLTSGIGLVFIVIGLFLIIYFSIQAQM